MTLHATANQLRLGQVVALGVTLLAVLAIVLLAFFSIAKHRVRLPLVFIPVPLALYSGVIGKQRNSSLLKTLRTKSYYERGIDRLNGRWVGAGIGGEEFGDSAAHGYEKDLHLFGEGSLFELLCTCRTEVGRRRLADYLLEAPTLGETKNRQEAIRELQTNSCLREEIAVLGEYSFEQASWEKIADWLSSPVHPVHRSFQIFALLTSATLGGAVLLGWDHVLSWTILMPWISGLLLTSAIGGFLYRNRVLTSSKASYSVGTQLRILRQGLELMQIQQFDSPLLAALVADSRTGGPLTHLRRLEHLTEAFIQRDKEWFYLGSRVLLVGTQVFLAIERWRLLYGDSMRRWLSIWGEFEALNALANYAHEHPENTFPTLSEEETVLEAEGLKHPMLAAEKCVPNQVALNQKTRFYVISGSNMSGKSTLLRTIGLNAVLAYAGAPVCADRMRLSLFQICASLAVRDSLLDGISRFFAEINRLKLALSAPPEGAPVLFLVDELLSGTNSNDRRVAGEVILRELIGRGAVGFLSTHDLALTELPTLDNLPGANMHMGSEDDSNPLSFDYILKPGVTRQSSALAIARMAGVPV